MSDKNTTTDFLGALSAGRLNELRRMLLGLDAEDLTRLNTLIQDPELFSDEISALLPLAMRKLINKGDISLEDVLPLIEEALRESIQRDPTTLAGILFPVMMPAIRKAVAEDIKRMIESLNSTLENGFSPKRIGWRFKALLSSRSYAEIVLSNAYIYRVKQVFLIHRETGLLLHQVFDQDIKNNADADMVSSMLTAIKDFIQDSFKVEEDQVLDSIQLGNLRVWLEQGPHTIIASIVEGNAPDKLRLVMKEAVEGIHVNFSYELERFRGDTTPFENNDRFIRMCLMKQEKEVKKKKPILITVIFALVLLALGYWAYTRIDQQMRFNKLVALLNNYPGLMVTDAGHKDGKLVVQGARDPFATNPDTVLDHFKFSAADVGLFFKPYVSLHPEMVLKRATAILHPPSTVDFSVGHDTLYASGEATQEWMAEAKNKANLVPGVGNYHTENLSLLSMNEVVRRDILAIEDRFFTFDFNVSELDQQQQLEFDRLIHEVNTLLDFSQEQDSVPLIAIIAHTNYSGDPKANERVAFNRAKQFIQFMKKSGIPEKSMVPIVNYLKDTDEAYPVRSVSFKVNYVKATEP